MPPSALPPLHLVRAFHAIGQAGSIRRGAAAIGVSHTVVSRHLRHLEAWIGAKLFERGPAGAVLTTEGRALFEATEVAFERLSSAIADIRPQNLIGALRIWVFPGLAGRWLGPRLAEIEALLPHVEITLRATEDIPDFAAHEADLFIGFAPEDALPLGARILAMPRMFPVASPSWIERNGRPENVEMLARYPLIHERSYGQWRRWLDAAGVATDIPLSGPRLWTASLGLDAATADQGIALATHLSVARELRNGRLVELLASDIRIGSYYLLTAPERQNKSPVLVFLTWLEQKLSLDTASDRPSS